MRFLFIAFLLIIASGCDKRDNLVEFEGLSIPKKYVISDPNVNSGVFDNDVSLGLLLDEEEIKLAIPEYIIENRGEKKLNILISKEPYNLEFLSSFVLENYEISVDKLTEDKYLPYKKFNITRKRWLLVDVINNKPFFRGSCGIRGINDEVVFCNFKRNIGRFGVGYMLENVNLKLQIKYENYIMSKIREWSKN